MAQITKKEVCKCTNCGNEAEMMVTCTLDDAQEPAHEKDIGSKEKEETMGRRVKGTATCTHCGNEADMWVDI